MNKIIIVGATSAIAKEVARLYAASSQTEFVLIGRNKELLELAVSDLKVRGADPSSRYIKTPLDKADLVAKVVKDAVSGLKPEIVLIAQGSLPSQELCERDSSYASAEITVNAISPVLWAEAFASSLGPNSDAVIAVIGSVAGDRGRKSNYVYGSSKALVETYIRGMQHRMFKSKLALLLIKPGPVYTPITSQLKGISPNMATTQEVARDIIKAIHARKSVLYTPRKWGVIMFVIRGIPTSIFNRTNL